MKQQVNSGMVIAGIIVAVLVVVLIAWRSFGSDGSQMDQATINAHVAAKRAKEGMH